MTNGIYLDNSMTTRPAEKAVAKMLPFFTEHWGIPSAPHAVGQGVCPAIEESYKLIYSALGATEHDGFVFTSSGAEAINHAIFSSYFDVSRTTGKNHFVTSTLEEAPTLMSVSRLEELGCTAKLAQANSSGIITAEAIGDAITPRTALVSLSWANGLTGVVQPIAEIAELCKRRGIRLHLDATHVLGKLYYNMDELGADLISFNGDHLHAPKGTGGLYIKSRTVCSPFIVGGLEQAGKRAGNLNVPGLISLGAAMSELLESRDYMCTEIARLRNKLEQGILVEYPDAVIFYKEQERLPHCTVIGFPGISNEALLYALNRQHLYACIGGGGFQQIGLVLSAAGIETTLAHSAINFSLSRFTTEEEIDHAIEIIGEAAKRLHKSSMHLFKGN